MGISEAWLGGDSFSWIAQRSGKAAAKAANVLAKGRGTSVSQKPYK